MKLLGIIITLIMAIYISVVAAWFSIEGMMVIFAASAASVAIMMIGLELAKLVTSVWLKLNWNNTNVNMAHKSYLMIAVIVLMAITSLGIFGKLSAGHLEQKAPLQGLEIKVQQLDIKIKQKESENTRINERLNQIDQNISVFLKNDDARQGLGASNQLKSERKSLQDSLNTNNNEINELNNQLIPLKLQSGSVEAKLGPIKYVAAMFGWDDTETAVRFVIILLMLVFDPLAVVLLLSAMISLKEWSERNISIADVVENSVDTKDVIEEDVIEEDVEADSEISIRNDHSENPITITPIVNEVVVEKNSITRDEVLEYLESHPELVSDFKEVVEEDLSDRDKLISLLEKNPQMVSEMAEVISNQLAKLTNAKNWLDD